MKGAKAVLGKLFVKGSALKLPVEKKESNPIRRTCSTKSNSSSIKPSPPETKGRKSKKSGPPEVPISAVQKEADERRLRKLKVFLKSVSYNGCEGSKLPNLNDLYGDQLLVDEFPCNELLQNEEFKCNPTPFVLASCFNRTQVTENHRNTGERKTGTRRTPRKPTPSKKTQLITERPKTSSKQPATPAKPNTRFMADKLKILNLQMANSTRTVLVEQGEKLQRKMEKEENFPKEETLITKEEVKNKTMNNIVEQ